MRILVLSFYYQPDLCAGSFRATALVNALKEKLPAESQIDVITTLPNRYSTFSQVAPETEAWDNVSIHRIKLPAHKSGMLDQSKAFFHFARQVIKLTRSQHYDLVCGTSSRLMTASLSAWIARQNKAKLYLDIRDLFVDTVKDIPSPKVVWVAKPFFSIVENWTFKRADKINLVSKGFMGYLNNRYPSKSCSFFTNGIDEEFINLESEENTRFSTDKPLSVLYAGNIGEGQGLHAIIPGLAKQMEGQIIFRLIGDGGRKKALDLLLKEKNIKNVELLPPVNREQLLKAYKEADILFLHLNDYEAFKKVLPSKIFEYAAIGKPIWAGVSGYSADFIKSEIRNAVVFRPCDVSEAKKAFSNLLLENTDRRSFIKKYDRSNIMKEMANDIISLLV